MKTLSFLLVLTLISFISKKVEQPTPFVFPSISYFPEPNYNEQNPITEEGVLAGRYLFYDSILSKDYSISCASCHQQKYAFSDAGKTFSTGMNGLLLDRNTPPIFNLNWSQSLFWDGRASTPEQQVLFPVRNHKEMNLDWKTAETRINGSKFYTDLFSKAFPNKKIDSILISYAIAQFERTIISNNSKFDKVLRGETHLTKEEYAGFELVNNQEKGDCLHCHVTDAHGLVTNGKFSNNGLDSSPLDSGQYLVTQNINDIGKFKIPSLRNLYLTAPYMHDGRFLTVEEVLEFYSSGLQKSYTIDSKMQHINNGGIQISEVEKKQIIAFLKCLTDSSLILNQDYSNPFIK